MPQPKNKVAAGKVQKPVAQPKPKPKPKPALISEIDDIFAAKPAATTKPAAVPKAPEPEPEPKPSAKHRNVKVIDASQADTAAKSSAKQKPPPKSDADSVFADSRGKNSKYTEDGLRVFYMDDLRIGEGEGDTELCPFDCNCCF
ncbi:hypothetical protein GGI07_004286 [Coemansia sp. Benny D115]|nr:hypothetical protein GGI07_004286 [Coemansia sp. Benny D115]